MWEPDALRALVAAFADPQVGYACGQVRFVNDTGTNQEGLYWRYEMWLRANESALASVTAGNGAIYAVRPEAYLAATMCSATTSRSRSTSSSADAGRSTWTRRGRPRRWSRRSRASGRASGG